MQAASAARPMMPSSASISRTRWPLPIPPIAGLQDIAPIVAALLVSSSVRAPIRAAAAAASVPAWPPPITITFAAATPGTPPVASAVAMYPGGSSACPSIRTMTSCLAASTAALAMFLWWSTAAAVVLLAAAKGVCGTGFPLPPGPTRQQAGTRRLDRLGGLARAMPVSTTGLLAGLAGLTGLPPAPGFAVLYLLFQAVLAGPRGNGLGSSLLLAALALLLVLGSTLASIALVRLGAMACLGRPRVPRAAAAEEIPSAARPALLVAAVLTGLLGLLPGPTVRLLAGGANGDFTGAALAQHIGWLTLTPGATAPGYAPIPIALLLALAIGVALRWRRRRTRTDIRAAPVWQDGFASAPPWLPFGDPAAQVTASGFAPPSSRFLPRLLRFGRRGALRRLLARVFPPLSMPAPRSPK